MNGGTVYRTPPGYLGALFLFWGFITGMTVLGMLIALLAEGHHLVRRKWELTRDDHIRISDISSIIMLAALFIIYLTSERWQMMRQFVIWLPVIHLPLLVTQLYGAADRIVIGTRVGGRKSGRVHAHRPFNITWVYAALLLFSAAAANNRTFWFFPGMALFVLWGLFVYRGRRYRAVVWWAVIVLVLLSAVTNAIAINRAYLYTQDRLMEYYSRWLARFYADPFKSDTALGDITALKLSDRILLRVDREWGPEAPFYLLDGVFDTYAATAWYNRDGHTRVVSIEENGTWALHEPPDTVGAALSISAWLPKSKGVIPIPGGAYALSRLNAAGLKETFFGAVLVEEGPELLDYTAFYLPGHSFAAPPGARDLMVPPDEIPALDRTLAELGDALHDPTMIISAIERHFFLRFTYTLDARPYGKEGTPVANFLLEHRRGHCEYFATATVLLLRRAGIPARYTTGFVADEWSPLEQAYVVRERHGHAWAMAWIEDPVRGAGRWVDVDTTPPGWIVSEAAAAGPFETVSDLFALLRYRYEQLRRIKNEQLNRALVVMIVLLALWLVYRVYARRRLGAAGRPDGGERRVTGPMDDSPFHRLATLLAAAGVTRRPEESYRHWLDRIVVIYRSRGEEPPFREEEVRELLALHERYRFHPQGLPAAERHGFLAKVTAWMERHRPS